MVARPVDLKAARLTETQLQPLADDHFQSGTPKLQMKMSST
jgi:hypothetical protein